MHHCAGATNTSGAAVCGPSVGVCGDGDFWVPAMDLTGSQLPPPVCCCLSTSLMERGVRGLKQASKDIHPDQ